MWLQPGVCFNIWSKRKAKAFFFGKLGTQEKSENLQAWLIRLLVLSEEILNVHKTIKNIHKEDDNIPLKREIQDIISKAFVCEIEVT